MRGKLKNLPDIIYQNRYILYAEQSESISGPGVLASVSGHPIHGLLAHVDAIFNEFYTILF